MRYGGKHRMEDGRTNGKNEEGKKSMDEVKNRWQAEHMNKRK